MNRERKLRILLVGDASGFHPTLAVGLRRLGHDVVVASSGCTRWMQTERDIDLSRPLPGKMGGLMLWWKLIKKYRARLEGYDIVSLSSQDFVELRPGRIKRVFDMLRAGNGSVFYSAVGSDWRYVEECLSPDTRLPYNDYMNNGVPTPFFESDPEGARSWTEGELRAAGEHIYSRVDGAVAALWEYYTALRCYFGQEGMAYGGIPIDTRAIEYSEMPDEGGKLRILLGRHSKRALSKGTDVLEAAARAVVERHPDRAELTVVENLPYTEYLDLQRRSHLILDQIYSYTPATAALQAMAMGRAVVSGGAPEYYDFIGENELRPIIHVEPDYESVSVRIEEAVADPRRLAERGRQGRLFVEKHNDTEVVAGRTLDFWIKRLNEREC